MSVSEYLYMITATPWFASVFLVELLAGILPWTRPVKEWTVEQAIRVRVVSMILHYWSLARSGDRLTLEPGSEGNRFQAIQPRDEKLYRGPLAGDALITPQPLGLTWTPARPPAPRVVGAETTVALHFHGGGFVIGDGRDHDTGDLARTMIRHMGCSHVCAPQYRLSSRKGGQFPAPLQDALTAYLYLLRDARIPAAQIILSGDSAGGNLVLGLLRYITEYKGELELPLPGAATLWSPWVDVHGAMHQDISASPYVRTDYVNGNFGRWGASTITGFGALDPADPYLSPLHHPFKLGAKLPVFVQAGACEVLSDDIQNFVEAFKKEDWLLHLTLVAHSPHDIMLLGPRMGFAKEAAWAAEQAGDFLLGNSGLRLRRA